MKKYAVLLFLVFFLIGCAPSKYAIKKSSDSEFADKNAPELVTLEENYIDFKDPMGLVPSSQLIPYAFVDKAGKINEMGFHLINVRSYDRWLNIRKGDQIVFIADEERLTAKAQNTEIDHITTGYNSVSKTVDTYYYDYAWYPLSKESMEKISKAKSIKLQIMGQDGLAEYGTKNRGFSIHKSFYENNRRFYEEVIMNSQI